MLKIVEIRETLTNSKVIDNIYAIEKVIKNIINDTESKIEMNFDDYKYIGILLEKSRTLLEKANEIIKFQY